VSRAAQTFKQGDVTKALKGAVKAGLRVQRVEIDREGKIVVITGGDMLASAITGNEWDNVR
jgi:hypothetical protein